MHNTGKRSHPLHIDMDNRAFWNRMAQHIFFRFHSRNGYTSYARNFGILYVNIYSDRRDNMHHPFGYVY